MKLRKGCLHLFISLRFGAREKCGVFQRRLGFGQNVEVGHVFLALLCPQSLLTSPHSLPLHHIPPPGTQDPRPDGSGAPRLSSGQFLVLLTVFVDARQDSSRESTPLCKSFPPVTLWGPGRTMMMAVSRLL